MAHLKLLTLSALCVSSIAPLTAAPAQIAIGIGVEPGCPYG
jgi:hypothetical protein